MRPTFLSLLLSTIFLTSFTRAITWTKRVYDVPGQRIERADFTGDGYPDLLIYDAAHINILPNVGTNKGKFDPTRTFTLDMGLSDAVVVDFNRDGNLDVAGCSDNGLVILLGNGNGTLTLAQTIPGPCPWLTTADFNKDGNPDLAVGRAAGPHTTDHNQVIIYLGDGMGGIASQIVNDNVNFISSDGNPCFLSGSGIAGDFTGDRIADIAITANCPNDVASNGILIVGKNDGSGHFDFHNDQAIGFEAKMKLRLVDADQNGNIDIYAPAGGSGPHAENWSDLILFRGHGDGTFAPNEIVVKDGQAAGKTLVGPGLILDVDGDGLMDAIAVVGFEDVDETNTTYQMQFYKGQSDGSFKLTSNSPLATGAFDMVWGDFDIDGRVDLALARLQPNTADVWLNSTSTAPRCGPVNDQRIAPFCALDTPSGDVHFIVRPFDTRIVNAIQLYVNGVLKFETHDDILNKVLHLNPGQNRVTVKAWDDLGPFSSVKTVTPISPCPNTTNRTIRICEPHDGGVFVNTIGVIRVIATAATNLKFNSLQVYIDGELKFTGTSKSAKLQFLILAGPTDTHHVTVKGWDSSGPFSSSVTVRTIREVND